MTTNPEGPGATGGLPGEQADPRTLELSPDEQADTVAGTGDDADGMPAHDPHGGTATNG